MLHISDPPTPKVICSFFVTTPITPQPNLNVGLGLTRFSLYNLKPHPPPTPHRNPTSTRKKDPRGLKFCRRPHPEKKQQPNTIFFWGGGWWWVIVVVGGGDGWWWWVMVVQRHFCIKPNPVEVKLG